MHIAVYCQASSARVRLAASFGNRDLLSGLIAQSGTEGGDRRRGPNKTETKKVLSDEDASSERADRRDSSADVRKLKPLGHKDLKLPEFRDEVYRKVEYLLHEPKKQNEFLDLVDEIKSRQMNYKRRQIIENAKRRQLCREREQARIEGKPLATSLVDYRGDQTRAKRDELMGETQSRKTFLLLRRDILAGLRYRKGVKQEIMEIRRCVAQKFIKRIRILCTIK